MQQRNHSLTLTTLTLAESDRSTLTRSLEEANKVLNQLEETNTALEKDADDLRASVREIEVGVLVRCFVRMVGYFVRSFRYLLCLPVFLSSFHVFVFRFDLSSFFYLSIVFW